MALPLNVNVNNVLLTLKGSSGSNVNNTYTATKTADQYGNVVTIKVTGSATQPQGRYGGPEKQFNFDFLVTYDAAKYPELQMSTVTSAINQIITGLNSR